MNKITVQMNLFERIAGWSYLFLQLLVLPVLLVLVNVKLGSPLSEGQLNGALFIINFVAVSAIFHRYLIRNGVTGFSRPGRMFATIGICFGAYQIMNMGLSFVIGIISPDFFNVNNDAISGMVKENPLLLIIGTSFLVPMVEEVLYRGLVFRTLYNRSKIAAYVISVVIFGALHVVGYITMYEPLQLLLCFLQYIPAGICLGFAYANTDSIWTPILMHMTINLMSSVAMIGG